MLLENVAKQKMSQKCFVVCFVTELTSFVLVMNVAWSISLCDVALL